MKKPLFALNLLFALLTFVGIPLLAQENVHHIKSGETLSLIARKYRTSVNELIRLNPDAAKGLKAGADLKLPGDVKIAQPARKESMSLPLESGSNTNADGKKHKVASGESLSRIARKYKVSVTDLENWNQMKAQDLKAGQEILVSGPAEADPKVSAAAQSEKVQSAPNTLETHSHIVFKGETLSSIAQKEGTSVAEIKKLNQLKNDQLKLGQVLRIPGSARPEKLQVASPVPSIPAETAARKEEAPEKNGNEKPATGRLETEPVRTATDLPVKTEIAVKQDEKPMAGIREVSNVLGYTRVVETGFAEAIEGDINSKKHLCLHKSAPVGSILQVKNEVNGQSVFVKVIGKLPETGSNEKLIIRISRQAYDRLLSSGKRFPVEVSYPEAQP